MTWQARALYESWRAIGSPGPDLPRDCGQLQKAQLVRGRELPGTSPRPARLEGLPVALFFTTGPGSSREPSQPGAPDARQFFSTSGSTACLPYPSLVGAAVEAGRGRNIFLGKP